MKIKQIQPIKKVKVYEHVVQALEEVILKNAMEPFDRLPSEKELARRLNVGTRSIREALKTLQTRGLIEIKHGAGIFVVDNKLDHFLETLTNSLKYALAGERDLMLELIYVRKIIEASLIAEVAKERTEEDLKRLRAIVAEMSEMVADGNIEQYNRLDTQFHQKIIAIKGNRIIMILYRYLIDLFQKSMTKTAVMKKNILSSFQEHKAILLCLEKKQGAAAKKLILNHLVRTKNTLRKGQ